MPETQFEVGGDRFDMAWTCQSRHRLRAGTSCPHLTAQRKHVGRNDANDLNPTLPCVHNELWTIYLAQSIHSLSPAARSDGRDKPSLFSAVRLALMVNSVGPAIGRSAGFAPR